eukprot:3472403-Pleurochrysis_carterae.AAC.1
MLAASVAGADGSRRNSGHKGIILSVQCVAVRPSAGFEFTIVRGSWATLGYGSASTDRVARVVGRAVRGALFSAPPTDIGVGVEDALAVEIVEFDARVLVADVDIVA